MCWTATTSEEYEKYIANDNIPVMKLVNIDYCNQIHSYYKDFGYILNITYKVDTFGLDARTIDNKIILIKKGFYSYSPKLKLDITRINFSKKPRIIDIRTKTKLVDKLVLRNNRNDFNIAIADCIIPKGAHYFLNNHGEYVSNAIKIINVYKIK